VPSLSPCRTHRRRHRSGAVALLALLFGTATAQIPDLKQIMADPDWIGPPVQSAWWQLDGTAAHYRVKRPGTKRTALFSIDLATGEAVKLGFEDQAPTDGAQPVLDPARERALYLREGSLFVRHLYTGALTQLTSADQPVSGFGFSADGSAVHYQRGERWWRHDLALGVARALTHLKMEKAPYDSEDDLLIEDQLRLFMRLADEVEEQRAAHEESREAAMADPARAQAPWYLGKGKKISESSLSADGRWLLAVVEPAKPDEGERDAMPKFVTRSGYVEIEDVRRLVGRNAATPQQLWLLDLQQREKHELALSDLSGIGVDPLAELKAAQEISPHDEDDPRPVRITGIAWHPQRAVAAVQVRAIDNKDRWLATVDAPQATLTERHRLTDNAWINWLFNDAGWLHTSNTLWFLSEESGFSHLYAIDLDSGITRQITGGTFEVSTIEIEPGADTALAITNASHPTEYDLYRVDLGTGELLRLTELLGVESYTRHPTQDQILVRHSGAYLPAQLSLVSGGAGSPSRQLTDTRAEAYRGIEWQPPEYVGVPSRHGAGAPIFSKFYRARGAAGDDGRYPVVVFVHGAGYTQNTHHKFPYYFREQMFHNLLTARGYHVLDMDYRASRGYGREWRTAIYRQMGTPELEDLKDGVAWLIANHDADPTRVGVYGGSYGGFMTFMAMFNAADTFAAGASLRPVTDWAHYNHFYTANILNTPEVDPEAYRRSSPIEFVDKLQGALLISHGMLDDNVFYKDSVRLVQRLIDLEKTDWELASYPLEPHGYVHPESWLDQYRRILKLFETTIGNAEGGPP
jgi:dipeptidyl aminopeptidase/acylaminoacyl peptidase